MASTHAPKILVPKVYLRSTGADSIMNEWKWTDNIVERIYYQEYVRFLENETEKERWSPSRSHSAVRRSLRSATYGGQHDAMYQDNAVAQ